ncbi:unknown [Bacteroides intestinalis CAG:315]|jgi:hypothetical protein|nr:hypothetical protein [Bacteroides intestinalis]CDD95692.1 unknown [Bacteroides intestinalis CAG:315]
MINYIGDELQVIQGRSLRLVNCGVAAVATTRHRNPTNSTTTNG